MGFWIKDRDNGYAALTRELFRDDTNNLDVGVLGPAASETYENGVTILQASIWAEFGTSTEPARSWLRHWFDENEDLVRFWMRGEMGRVVDGKQTKEEALRQVGKKCVAGIRQRILEKLSPENAKSTEKKKGFNHPLLNSGRFLKAIGFLVRRHDPR